MPYITFVCYAIWLNEHRIKCNFIKMKNFLFQTIMYWLSTVPENHFRVKYYIICEIIFLIKFVFIHLFNSTWMSREAGCWWFKLVSYVYCMDTTCLPKRARSSVHHREDHTCPELSTSGDQWYPFPRWRILPVPARYHSPKCLFHRFVILSWFILNLV